MAQARRTAGFTLLEVMVVTSISLMLLGISTFVYLNCLKAYKETQGLVSVYDTSKYIERAFHDYLGHVIPVPGNWVTPYGVAGLSPGGVNDARFTTMYRYYTTFGAGYEFMLVYKHDSACDRYFSGTQQSYVDYTKKYPWGLTRYLKNGIGIALPQFIGAAWTNNGLDEKTAVGFRLESATGYPCQGLWARSGYWQPAFYGYRDARAALSAPVGNGSSTRVLEVNNIFAGSWGWPRPDYRMNIDADNLDAAGLAKAPANTCACVFYCESPYYDAKCTMVLDNPNLFVCSIKYMRVVNPVSKVETTQLSFLKHHVLGWDQPWLDGAGLDAAREDVCPAGNMLRAVKITPYYLDATGSLLPAGDTELGMHLNGSMESNAANVAKATAVPRCFDVQYKLRHAQTQKDYTFCTRIFTRVNPQ